MSYLAYRDSMGSHVLSEKEYTPPAGGTARLNVRTGTGTNDIIKYGWTTNTSATKYCPIKAVIKNGVTAYIGRSEASQTSASRSSEYTHNNSTLTDTLTSATSYHTRSSGYNANSETYTKEVTTGTTYLTRSSGYNANSETYTAEVTTGITYLTRSSTSATSYHTRESSYTNYTTSSRVSTSGYATRASTSATVYLTKTSSRRSEYASTKINSASGFMAAYNNTVTYWGLSPTTKVFTYSNGDREQQIQYSTTVPLGVVFWSGVTGTVTAQYAGNSKSYRGTGYEILASGYITSSQYTVTTGTQYNTRSSTSATLTRSSQYTVNSQSSTRASTSSSSPLTRSSTSSTSYGVSTQTNTNYTTSSRASTSNTSYGVSTQTNTNYTTSSRASTSSTSPLTHTNTYTTTATASRRSDYTYTVSTHNFNV